MEIKLALHGLSQPAVFWTAFTEILDGHLKKTAFGRLFIIFSDPCWQGFAPYSREHALRLQYMPDPG